MSDLRGLDHPRGASPDRVGARTRCSLCPGECRDDPTSVPVADAKIRGSNPWGYLCMNHYLEDGAAPGHGTAQVLVTMADT